MYCMFYYFGEFSFSIILTIQYYYYSLFRDAVQGDNNIQEEVDAAAMSAVQE